MRIFCLFVKDRCYADNNRIDNRHTRPVTILFQTYKNGEEGAPSMVSIHTQAHILTLHRMESKHATLLSYGHICNFCIQLFSNMSGVIIAVNQSAAHVTRQSCVIVTQSAHTV